MGLKRGIARLGGLANAGPAAPAGSRAKALRPPSQTFVRIAILAALLLLAVYTAFGYIVIAIVVFILIFFEE